ncbi:hypothetical protein BJX68DRAFT_244225, partial [Aspergillus pseudodeflectus]
MAPKCSPKKSRTAIMLDVVGVAIILNSAVELRVCLAQMAQICLRVNRLCDALYQLGGKIKESHLDHYQLDLAMVNDLEEPKPLFPVRT